MLVEFELIEKARQGDGAAFNQVVTAYRRRILGTISRLIGRPEDVEDVAQEVFLRLYFSLDRLRVPEAFEPWLYRLSVNACYDYLRRSRRQPETRMSDLSEQERVRDLVTDMFSAVSEEDRILLTLKEVEGLSLRELEAVYGVNENALKVRLFRARQRVLKNMNKVTEGALPFAKTTKGT